MKSDIRYSCDAEREIVGYDALVVGLGGMGSAASYHLAKDGHEVLGLEAFSRGHTWGSSHGGSRIIREAYAEAVEYVPLVQRAYALWQELEAESGQDLLTVTGGLVAGLRDGKILQGSLNSARKHNLRIEQLSAVDVAERYPGIRFSDDLAAIYDPRSGILNPEKCVDAHLDRAEQLGAEIHHEEPVLDWGATSSGAWVRTHQGTYEAERLIFTAGPWAGQLLDDLRLPLTVERVVNVHFEPKKPELYGPDICPVYTLTFPEVSYYGFPLLPGQGMKVGSHTGTPTSPDDVKRTVEDSEIEEYRQVLENYFPDAAGAYKRSVTCLYTTTPDRNFIIDRHPEHNHVVFACGFSGHGFKFCSIVGEILGQLAVAGNSDYSIDFLSASRFAESSVYGSSSMGG